MDAFINPELHVFFTLSYLCGQDGPNNQWNAVT